jgi:hypothetical protein
MGRLSGRCRPQTGGVQGGLRCRANAISCQFVAIG